MVPHAIVGSVSSSRVRRSWLQQSCDLYQKGHRVQLIKISFLLVKLNLISAVSGKISQPIETIFATPTFAGDHRLRTVDL